MTAAGPPVPDSAIVATGVRGANIRHQLRALTAGRLGGSGTVVAFIAGFVAVIGIGVAVVAIVAPSTKPLCQPYKPCGTPPRAGPPMINFTLWRSPQFGYTLEYPSNVATVAQQSSDGLTFGVKLQNGDQATIIVRAASTSQVSPSQGVTNLLGNLNGVTQIASDPSAADQILGATIGHRPGTGGAYVGSITSPQGVSNSAGLGAEAATDGRVTIVAVAVGAQSDAGTQTELYDLADFILESVQWAS